MVAESFVREMEEPISDHESAAVLRNAQQEAELARCVGLFKHAQAVEQQPDFDRLGRQCLHPLSEQELGQWRTYLPMRYRVRFARQGVHTALVFPVQNGSDRLLRSMSEYEFDRVPRPAVEIMERAKTEWKFDWLEILTPEESKDDPALIGGIGNRVFLLYRWAESAAQLLSFDELADRARELRRLNDWNNLVQIGFWMSMFCTFLGSFLFTILGHHGLGTLVGMLLAGCTTSVGLGAFLEIKLDQARARVYARPPRPPLPR